MAMWVLGMLGVGGCGDARPPADLALRARLAVPATAVTRPVGARVDLAGQVRHARGLVRQPDGSYETVCVDVPDQLRPATPPSAREPARGERR